MLRLTLTTRVYKIISLSSAVDDALSSNRLCNITVVCELELTVALIWLLVGWTVSPSSNGNSNDHYEGTRWIQSTATSCM